MSIVLKAMSGERKREWSGKPSMADARAGAVVDARDGRTRMRQACDEEALTAPMDRNRSVNVMACV